jgi:hypothetical protein
MSRNSHTLFVSAAAVTDTLFTFLSAIDIEQ